MDPEQRERMLNFLRMHKLREMATPILLEIFRTRWAEYIEIEHQNIGSSSFGSQWVDGSGCGEKLVKICKNNAVPLLSFVIKEMRIGDTNNWDISLLTAAIPAITKCILQKDPNAINCSAYANEDTQIETIRQFRNEISHSSKSELTKQEFDRLWHQMTDALTKLGVSEAQLETVKAMDFAEPMKILTEAEEIKEKANDAYNSGKLAEAIGLYTRILQMEGLPADFQGIVYSNRSVAHLHQNKVKQAKADAKLAIHMRPNWWRGYQRLGMAYKSQDKLDEALDQLKTALELNPDAHEIREEVSALRQQIGVRSRREHARPHPELDTTEEQLEKVRQRLGMAPGEMDKVMEMTKNHPEFGEIMKGHRYRDGRGAQQDYVQAATHYSRAAAKGNPEAMYNLALLYGEGKGVQRNFETSFYWLRKAAGTKSRVRVANYVELGIAEAQHALGLRYADGIWVAQNYREAAKWYQLAVDNGFGPSANNLGLFYKNGTGVYRSLVKAFELFKMASEKGETPGMMNLAECYLKADGTGSFVPTAADRKMALYWLEHAASLGDTHAAEELENVKEIPLEYLQMASLSSSTSMDLGFQNSLSDEHRQYVPAVKEAAEKGSKTALGVLTIWNCQRVAMDAFKSGDHAKLVREMATAIRLDHELAKVPELFRPVVQKRLKDNPDDLDSIVCHVRLNSGKGMELFEFLGKCLQKFPTDPFLVEMRAIGLSMLFEQNNKAVKLLEKALQSDTNNIRLLYYRAFFFSMNVVDFDATNSAWDAFLAVAPADHRKVPAAYYRKAENFWRIRDAVKCVQHFEMGLAIEKKLLPCFLPYVFPPKNLLEKKIGHLITSHQQSTSTMLQRLANDIQSHRRWLLTKSREHFSIIEEGKEHLNFRPANIGTIPKPNAPSLIGLKKITIKEMSPDTVYNWFALEVWTIDWPYKNKLKALQLCVEDEHGTAERLAIYNWPNSEDTGLMLQTFGPRRKLTIINPHLRTAKDGERQLRVESPEFVLLAERAGKSCHCCGKEIEEKSIKKCAKCLVAVYCSKECQVLDWKEFGHKLVCKHLGKYAQQVNG